MTMRFYQNINTYFVLFLVLGFIQCSPEKTDQAPLIIGPYLQNMSDEEVTICWSTLEGKTVIRDGDTIVQNVNQYHHHKSIITDLEPGTKYQYDVLQDGTSRGQGSFTTFPADFQPFHFAVLGDTRTRHDFHQRIVNQIIKENPLFVINTGDLVSNGNNMEHWEHFFRINDQLIRHVPYYTVLGNHEHDSD
ncbi:metallophosphoesterase, partial [Bacteroidota bacterium]